VIHKLLETETILPDDYPIYAGYMYIADNTFIRSGVFCTVSVFKKALNAKEIRRCDLFGHYDPKIGEKVFSSYYGV